MTDMPVPSSPSQAEPSRSLPARQLTAPRTSPRLFKLFALYVRHYARKQLNSIRVSQDSHTLDQFGDRPILIFLNHPGWWDPLVCLFAADHWLPAYKCFAPIDAKAVEKYAFMKRIGFIPLDQQNAGSIKQFLRSTDHILTKENHALWITAQGTFADTRQRPITLMPGLARIVKRHPDCVVIPLALEYTHWSEKFPEAFMHFGKPVTDREDLQNALTQAMEKTMDELAEKVIARDPAAFDTLLNGKRGVGGPYGMWRHFKAIITGRKYDPAHQGENT